MTTQMAGAGSAANQIRAARRLRHALLAGAALFLPANPVFAQTNDDEPAFGNDEIVVTARKREENLQQVPLSVAAISGEQLEERSIDTLQELSLTTPNFSMGEQSNSGRLAGTSFIRGVGQRDVTPAYDPAVGTYIDGVYMGRMWGNNLDLIDLERVEVLRGPQGTLFGKNTSGGAVSIVTRAPDLETDAPEGRFQLTTGSRNRFDVLASANLPLIDDVLAMRVGVSYNRQDGYGERADGQDMANTNRWSTRGQILFQPVASTSATLGFDYLDFDERAASFRLVDVNTAAAPVAAYNGALNPDYDDTWRSQDYRFNATGPNYGRGSLWGVSLTIDHDFGWASLRSISAYREMDIDNGLDPDGSPITVLDYTETLTQNQFSQEFQLTGSSFNDRFEWVLGAYFFTEEADDGIDNILLPALFGGTQNFRTDSHVENESRAIYGQGAYSLTDRLRLTAGLRYTEDEKLHIFTRTLARPFAAPPGEHDSTAISPRLGLDYQWTPDVMTYVSVAQGAKNGGWTGRPGRLTDWAEFDDETVWTYEVGVRSDLLDNRLRFNATLFYSQYADLQLQMAGSAATGTPPVATPFAIIANIPESTIQGAEVELSYAPNANWVFSAALGLVDAKYDEFPDDPLFQAFVTSGAMSIDNAFSNTPESSLALSGEYNTTFSNDIEMRARLDYSWRDDVYFNPENSTYSFQPAFGLLNGRVTFLAPSGLSVSIFGNNLTDETYIVGAFDDSAKPNPGLGFAIVNQAAPQEFGVSVGYRF